MEQAEQIRQKLETRKQDLQATLARFLENARDSGASDVQDEIDQVITSETKTTALTIGTREYQALRDVEAALTRLEDGTYGRCIVCGKPIEPARLDAIPETPYCLEHADEGLQTAAATGGPG